MEIFNTLLFILLLVLSLAVISLFDLYFSIRDRHNNLVDLFIDLEIRQLTDRKLIFKLSDEIADLRKKVEREKSKKKTSTRKDTKKK